MEARMHLDSSLGDQSLEELAHVARSAQQAVVARESALLKSDQHLGVIAELLSKPATKSLVNDLLILSHLSHSEHRMGALADLLARAEHYMLTLATSSWRERFLLGNQVRQVKVDLADFLAEANASALQHEVQEALALACKSRVPVPSTRALHPGAERRYLMEAFPGGAEVVIPGLPSADVQSVSGVTHGDQEGRGLFNSCGEAADDGKHFGDCTSPPEHNCDRNSSVEKDGDKGDGEGGGALTPEAAPEHGAPSHENGIEKSSECPGSDDGVHGGDEMQPVETTQVTEVAAAWPAVASSADSGDGAALQHNASLVHSILRDMHHQQRIAVVGPAGMDKAAIALHVFNEARHRFERAVFLKLGCHADVPALLVQTWTQLFPGSSVPFQSAEHTRAALSAGLRGTRVLVVLADACRPADVVAMSFLSLFELHDEAHRLLVTTSSPETLPEASGGEPAWHTFHPDRLSAELAEQVLCRHAVVPATAVGVHDGFPVQRLAAACVGLPLLLRTVGACVRGRHHDVWRDAAVQLEALQEPFDVARHGVVERARLALTLLPPSTTRCLAAFAAFPESAEVERGLLLSLYAALSPLPGSFASAWGHSQLAHLTACGLVKRHVHRADEHHQWRTCSYQTVTYSTHPVLRAAALCTDQDMYIYGSLAPYSAQSTATDERVGAGGEGDTTSHGDDGFGVVGAVERRATGNSKGDGDNGIAETGSAVCRAGQVAQASQAAASQPDGDPAARSEAAELPDSTPNGELDGGRRLEPSVTGLDEQGVGGRSPLGGGLSTRSSGGVPSAASNGIVADRDERRLLRSYSSFRGMVPGHKSTAAGGAGRLQRCQTQHRLGSVDTSASEAAQRGVWSSPGGSDAGAGGLHAGVGALDDAEGTAEDKLVTDAVLCSLHGCSLPAVHLEAGRARALVLDSAGCQQVGAAGECTHLRFVSMQNCTCSVPPLEVDRLLPLRALHLRGCEHLSHLPATLGTLSQLTGLDLYGCVSLSTLPDAIGSLGSLNRLVLANCYSLRSLPDTIGGLKRLQELDAFQCVGLTVLPTAIVGVSELSYLNLKCCSRLHSLPAGIVQLKRLRALDLTDCSGLKVLPSSMGLLSSLRDLRLGSEDASPEALSALASAAAPAAGTGGGAGDLQSPPATVPRVSLLPILSAFRSLVNITRLELLRFQTLTTLPEAVSHLERLEVLTIRFCTPLAALPEALTALQQLRELEVVGEEVAVLPSGIGSLPQLQRLLLAAEGSWGWSGCRSLRNIPESVGHLGQLKELDLSGCAALRAVPALPGASQLQRLLLRDCGVLVRLPESVGSLQQLTQLDLQGCRALSSLPEALDGLHRLQELNCSGCAWLQGLPYSIGAMTQLRVLNLQGCASLGVLPASIESLSCLRVLDMQRCTALRDLPEGLGSLHQLQQLDVCSCVLLQRLPDTLSALRDLHYLGLQGCSQLQALPEGLGDMLHLQELSLTGSELLTCLPDSLGALSHLRRLELVRCFALCELPATLGSLLKLTRLLLWECTSLQSLPPSIGSLPQLHELLLGGCVSLSAIPQSVGCLSQLRVLDLSFCRQITALPASLGQLVNLQELYMSECESLSTLPSSMCQLSSLHILDARRCAHVDVPECIGDMLELRALHITESTALSALPDSVGQLSLLQQLDLKGCLALAELNGALANLPHLQALDMSSCSSLCCVPAWLSALASLQQLFMSNCAGIASLPESIGTLASLRELDASECGLLEGLPESIGDLAQLQGLRLSGCMALASLPESIGRLGALQKLFLTGCTALASLPDSIGGCGQLQRLSLGGCTALSSLPLSLGELRALEVLDLSECASLTSLPESVGELVRLQVLDVRECSLLHYLPPSVSNLVYVEIVGF